MWERGARHNPASFRYRFYMDHRPILPQDPTLEFVRKSYNQYENIYFCFRTSQNKVKYIFSNNLPVKDREELKALVNMDNLVGKSIKYFALLFSLFLSGYVFNKMNFAKKYHKRIGVVLASYFANYGVLQNMYSYKFQEFTSHYYFKFQHLAVDDINEIKDKRRSYFTVDKSVYYRESSSDIRHAAHHPANEGHHDHDTSTYYGPYPYDDHLNLETVEEISRKFTEGVSKFDNPENELLLGEQIDIKRNIRTLPSATDYLRL